MFFFFNDTATTEIYTLSLHDALPILGERARAVGSRHRQARRHRPEDRRHGGEHLRHGGGGGAVWRDGGPRSEEHTSELQSQSNLVCRLLLEKKKKQATYPPHECAQ